MQSGLASLAHKTQQPWRNMDNILLNLSTKRERPKIKIDSRLYELTVYQDMSMPDLTEMQERAEKAQALSGKKGMTAQDREELEGLVDQSIYKIVKKIKPKIINKLSHKQKIQIVAVFSKAVVGMGISRRRGGQSPGSKDSTEEIQ